MIRRAVRRPVIAHRGSPYDWMNSSRSSFTVSGLIVDMLDHGDRPILAVQHWLQANVQAAISVAQLAGRAALGERTFLRRFVKATRMKPSGYHQKLRIARSQELLELTRDTVDQIAIAIGYEDPGSFRRTFKRVVGLSPSEYRRRFQRTLESPASNRAVPEGVRR